MSNDVKFVIGMLAGSLVGYAVATLAAPEKGNKLREKILTEMDKVAQKLIDEGTEMTERAQAGHSKYS